MKEQNFEQNNGALWPFLKRLLPYNFRYKKFFNGFLVCIIFVGISDALWPFLWMMFLDEVVVPNSNTFDVVLTQEVWTNLYWFAGLFLVNGILQVIGVFGFIHWAGRIQEYVLFDLRQEMFEKLQQLSFSFFDKSQNGWLLTRVTSDTDRVCEVISWGLLDFVWGVTMIIFCLTAMFIYQWQLALIVLVSIPLLILISIRVRMLILKYSRKSRKINSEITASFTEHIQGVEENKSTAQEERVTDDFKGQSGVMQNVTFKVTYFSAMYMPLVILTGSLAAALIVYYGGGMAASTTSGITIGVLAASFAYATRIFLPILDISRFYALAQGSLSAGERIFGLLDEEVSIKDGNYAATKESFRGNVEFKNVSFGYGDRLVLNEFNLKVPAGQSVAIVGETGGGKTTIVNLVSRFYEATGGVIEMDGIEISDFEKRSLRKNMGLVLQTPHLFAGTLFDNLIYGNPNASKEKVIQTLQLVGSDEFIDQLDMEVGEGGDNLSLGQRQIISLARALLADPKIFIMDEATSSIDSVHEAKIQKGILRLIENRTSFIIAHRLSTIKNCDRILVIENGTIIEDGNHKELVSQKGKYFKLYTNQRRNQNIA